ncbi:MAG: PD40 domain-containing protein, partial [Bacteroidales bacterium]|nr:PD40 domain-containing protein [Candidatus Colimorpha onthohippi]
MNSYLFSNGRIWGVLCALLLLFSCNRPSADQGNDIIDRQDIKVEDGRLTIEAMWAMGNLGGVTISPDGQRMAYTIRYTSIERDGGNSDVYVQSISGGESRRITTTAESEGNVVWMDNGRLAFIRNNRIVAVDIESLKEDVVAEFEQPIEGFKLSPDGSRMIYISTVSRERSDNQDKLYEGLDKTTGRINEDLMYRHWDTWVDDYPHIFLA